MSRPRPLHSSRFWFLWTLVLATVFLSLIVAWTMPYIIGSSEDDSAWFPSIDPTSPSASPTPSADPTEGGVLTEDVLAAVDEGWLLVTERIAATGAIALRVIDPAGAAYDGVRLTQDTDLLAWLPDGRAVIAEGDAVDLVDLVDGERTPLGSWESPTAVADPEGGAVYIVSHAATGATVDEVALADGAVTERMKVPGITALVASPDGTELLAGGDSGMWLGTLVDGVTTTETLQPPAASGGCLPSAWAPGRQAIVTCLGGEETRLWALEATTGAYAEASTRPAAGEVALAVSATRALVAGEVATVAGNPVWSLPESVMGATEAVWTGDALALLMPSDDGASPTLTLLSAAGVENYTRETAAGSGGYLDVVAPVLSLP
ncbi:hypothetical protein [Demequina sp. NBRC 110052]|uniref:hypothetical protein n=1 Tax=Demequina sp. NBRC 110052 TaxID=1570341 RepID=UPI00117F45B4|nr:hypothetical protein [Demequina sp. NBRC 110052]